ncbi:hypothetical protein AB0E56_13000 [Microbacterium sp. NPDC028030]|uniref:hypothetical protein n=1 Tax=Microbacterium sp. NPDC028030 TaxID=3155124 RepID=UPI0033DF8BBC
MKLYAKSLLYVLLAIAGVLVTALTDNIVTTSELVNVGIVGVGAVGVYVVPNSPEGVARFLKTAVAFVAAALVALSSFLTDGITTSEWLQIAVAAFAGIGVYIIPNEAVPTNLMRFAGPLNITGAMQISDEAQRTNTREN